MEFIYIEDSVIDTKNIISKNKFDDILLIHLNDIVETRDKPTLSTRLEKKIPDDQTIVETYVKEFGKYDTYHQGYIWYLYHSYKQDAGIIVAPWHFYNVIFHQISKIIIENEEIFKPIFTSSKDKIKIQMETLDLDIDLYNDLIKSFLPNPEVYDNFFPVFSETPLCYNESMKGLFAEMVQKYYGAMLYGCSLPKVKVSGSEEDWITLNNTVNQLLELFHSYDINICDSYLNKVSNYTEFLKTNYSNKDTWAKLFKIGECGSGSQECVIGDILNIINTDGKLIDNSFLTSSIPSIISRFKFENLKVYGREQSSFISGLVGSNFVDGYAIPHYDYATCFVDETKMIMNDVELKDLENYMKLHNKLEFFTETNLKNHITCEQEIYYKKIKQEHYINDVNLLKINELGLDEFVNTCYSHLPKTQLKNNRTDVSQDDIRKLFEINLEVHIDIDKYVAKKELERIELLQTKYHIFFEGMTYMTNFSNKHALTLDQYIKQRDKAYELYKELLNKDTLSQFINNYKYYTNNYYNSLDITYMILSTLDFELLALYIELTKTDKSVKKIIHSIYLGAGNNYFKRFFKFDDELKIHLTNEFNVKCYNLIKDIA